MIAMLMESLREQTQTIASYEGRIPQIEIDIVMSNLRKVYDYCTTLNLLNQGQGMVRLEHSRPGHSPVLPSVDQREKVDDTPPKPVEDEVFLPPAELPVPGRPDDGPVAGEHSLKIDSADNAGVKQPEADHYGDGESVAAVAPEDTTNSKGTTALPEEPSVSAPESVQPDPEPVAKPAVSGSLFSAEPSGQPALKQEPKHHKVPEPDLFGFGTPTLADTLQPDARPLVADRFAGKDTDQSLASRLGSKNITDMKEAIGINDKFLLINELFKGNQHHYNQALHFLNNAESFDEAMGMFSRMFTELKWNSESKAVEKLKSLIERRHGGAAH